jgi:hypothetical protein
VASEVLGDGIEPRHRDDFVEIAGREMPLRSPMFGFSALFLPAVFPGAAPLRPGPRTGRRRRRGDPELAEAAELVLERD